MSNSGVLTLVEPEATKRLNVNLSESEHAQLKELARASRLSMTELVRLAVDIVEDVLRDRPKGHPHQLRHRQPRRARLAAQEVV